MSDPQVPANWDGWPPAAQPAGYRQAPVDVAAITGLPIEERSFSSFYRAPRWRWWKPILAAILVVVVFFLTAIVFSIVGLAIDRVNPAQLAAGVEGIPVGPGLFLSNNIAIALGIPTAFGVHWLFTGQRPRWLSSVAGGFRWGWFARCVAIALPLWIVLIVVETLITGLPPDLSLRPYTVVMVIGILLTTPFQAAGEEYLMRGLEQRLVASYFRSEWVGLIVGGLASSLTFMSLHAAADPWLNVFYFTFGVVATWITWRTGGLEAAVAIHVVNNLLSEALLPFTDFSGMFDRSVGTGDPTVLINLAVLVVTAAVYAWLGKRRGLVVRSAPGRAEVERQLPRLW